jgi:DNA-3-methyladenine glycosylase I
MADAGIVRNRAEIEATVTNARRCIDLVEEVGSLAGYVWRLEPDAASRPTPLSWQMVPSTSPEATAMSKDLKRRGWAFVGPTNVYAFM